MRKVHRRIRRTSEQMFPLVEKYESSGQLQKDFCEHHDISIGTFQYWLKKYRLEDPGKSHSFQEITVLPKSDNSGHESRYILISTPSGMEIKIPLD